MPKERRRAGAIGGPQWDHLPVERRPEAGALLPLRQKLGLFANLRPVILYEALIDASPLKREIVEGEILVIHPRADRRALFWGKEAVKIPGGEQATDTLVYTTPEIERIGRLAFESASKRRKVLHSVDKANAGKFPAMAGGNGPIA